jgi:hypothetical protein
VRSHAVKLPYLVSPIRVASRAEAHYTRIVGSNISLSLILSAFLCVRGLTLVDGCLKVG